LHPKVRSIYLYPLGGFHNIKDPDALGNQKILSLCYGFNGIFIDQAQIKDTVQDGPEHSIAAPIAEIHIVFPELPGGKTRRGQGSHDKLGSSWEQKGFIGVHMFEHRDGPSACQAEFLLALMFPYRERVTIFS